MPVAPGSVTVALLADYPQLVGAVARMRWEEWGDEPGREQLAWWVDVSTREAGRDVLPVTWVAFDDQGEALGAVGLAEYDIEERRDRSPWLVGMIVRADLRRTGIGRRLVAALEAWARAQGDRQAWVATGDPAVGFYEACGWKVHEKLARGGEITTVLLRQLA